MTGTPPPEERERPRPRIVEVVFAGDAGRPGRRLLGGIATMTALYGGLVVLVTSRGPSAATSSGAMSARAHDLVSARAIDLAISLAPPPIAPTVAEGRAPRTVTPRPPSRSQPTVLRSRAAPPAQAGAIAAAASSEPVDFTGMAFVVGSGTSYAGGKTSASGTSHTAVPPHAAAPGAPIGAPTGLAARARPVALDQAAWACPWPDEADSQQIDEQTVVLRAGVDADGHVWMVEILADPGAGFAQAARACALRTRFQPAHDASGAAVAASSPPIRVHFFR